MRMSGSRQASPPKAVSQFVDRKSCCWFSATASVPRSADGTSKDAERQDLLHHPQGLAAALNAKIRLPVIRQPLFVEFTKTRFVAEERPVSHEYTALQKLFGRAIEPNDGRAQAPFCRARFADERGAT